MDAHDEFQDHKGRTLRMRPTTPEDAEAALRYYNELLEERCPFILANPLPTLEEERQFIVARQGDAGVLLAAWSGAHIVGSCGVLVHPHPQRSHAAVLGISVLRPMRGGGIGSRLLSGAIEWCRAHNLKRLELDMIDGNPAERLYRRMGFETEGRRRAAHRRGDAFVDVVVMSRLF